MKAYIFHGIFGNPEENWFPWLKAELEKKSITTEIPKFPNPNKPQLAEWLEFFNNYEVDEETILIGHSLGCAFALNVLEKRGPVNDCYLISPFITDIQNEEFNPLMANFTHKQFNKEAIRKHAKSFTVFHSNNDPYIPLELAQKVVNLLDAKLIIVKDAGHFNTPAGYTTFPKLLKEITSQ